jgi:hypothetical protein
MKTIYDGEWYFFSIGWTLVLQVDEIFSCRMKKI